MTVERTQLPITSPCPIELDRSGAAPEDRQLHCAHCSKEVHLLSQMTEAEARELMIRRAGDDICVSYAMSADGRIRFRSEPVLVPPTRLVRPLPARRLSMAASIGAAALLSACAPHETDPGPAGTDPIEVTDQRPDGVGSEAPPEIGPVTPVVAGGLVAAPLPPEQPCDPEPDLQVDGGLKAMPIDEAPPEPTPTNVGTKADQHKAGGLRARPIPNNADAPDPLAAR